MPNDLVYVLQQFNPQFPKSQPHVPDTKLKPDDSAVDLNRNLSQTTLNQFTFKRKYASQSNIRRNQKSSNTFEGSKQASISSTIDDFDDLNDRYQTSFDKSLENIQMLNRMKSQDKKFQVRV